MTYIAYVNVQYEETNNNDVIYDKCLLPFFFCSQKLMIG